MRFPRPLLSVAQLHTAAVSKSRLRPVACRTFTSTISLARDENEKKEKREESRRADDPVLDAIVYGNILDLPPQTKRAESSGAGKEQQTKGEGDEFPNDTQEGDGIEIEMTGEFRGKWEIRVTGEKEKVEESWWSRIWNDRDDNRGGGGGSD